MKSKQMLLRFILTVVFCAIIGLSKSQVVFIHFTDTLRYQVVDSSETYLLYEKDWIAPGTFRLNLKDEIYWPYFTVATKNTRDTIYAGMLESRHYFFD